MNTTKGLASPHIAVILAAGYGSRIRTLTDDPKCLLPLGGATLLERHLNIWKALGIRQVHLVLGYKAALIREVVKKYCEDFEIRFYLNEDFERQGNTYSLLLGIEQAKAATLIFDADLVYDQAILKAFIEDVAPDSILVGEGSPEDIECAKTLVDAQGFVRRTVDKRALTPDELERYRFAGEAMGILKFSSSTTRALAEAARTFLSKPENRSLNWEHLLNAFLPNHDVRIAKNKLPNWIEIDTLEDYKRAEQLFLKRS